MAFWKGGGGKRRDANEKAIVAALEAAGAQVWQISGRACRISSRGLEAVLTSLK